MSRPYRKHITYLARNIILVGIGCINTSALAATYSSKATVDANFTVIVRDTNPQNNVIDIRFGEGAAATNASADYYETLNVNGHIDTSQSSKTKQNLSIFIKQPASLVNKEIKFTFKQTGTETLPSTGPNPSNVYTTATLSCGTATPTRFTINNTNETHSVSLTFSGQPDSTGPGAGQYEACNLVISPGVKLATGTTLVAGATALKAYTLEVEGSFTT